jgi:hypothetical protein
MNLLHHGHQERWFIVLLDLGQISPLLWLAAISGPMVGAPAVVTLVVMLRHLLPIVVVLAQALALLTATGQALPSVVAMVCLLLPLLLHEELAVYARWWQRVILHVAILRHTQPATDIFQCQLRQVLGNLNRDGHLRDVLGDDPQ